MNRCVTEAQLTRFGGQNLELLEIISIFQKNELVYQH